VLPKVQQAAEQIGRIASGGMSGSPGSLAQASDTVR
jgi:hypothetical protein